MDYIAGEIETDEMFDELTDIDPTPDDYDTQCRSRIDYAALSCLTVLVVLTLLVTLMSCWIMVV